MDFSKCKLTSEGLDYRGNVSRTASGRTCQRWDRQYPWTHRYTDLIGGNSVHENYCRNLIAGEEPTPWCYTTDENVRWEHCDIPICGIYPFKLKPFELLKRRSFNVVLVGILHWYQL